MPHPRPASAATATREVEKADLAIVQKTGDQRGHPLVRFAGSLSEIADQPQMTVVCCATVLAGLARRDPHLAGTGLRMLAAHGLATLAKSRLKHSVKRTRPEVVLDEGRYDMRKGKAETHEEGSFPSGHTSSAVAVAGAAGFGYPALAVPALAAAAAIAAVQIPRGKHYASDLTVGALIGASACTAVEIVFRIVSRGPSGPA